MTTARITILPSGTAILDDGRFPHQHASLRDALAACRREGLTPHVEPTGPCAPQAVAWSPALLVL